MKAKRIQFALSSPVKVQHEMSLLIGNPLCMCVCVCVGGHFKVHCTVNEYVRLATQASAASVYVCVCACVLYFNLVLHKTRRALKCLEIYVSYLSACVSECA